MLRSFLHQVNIEISKQLAGIVGSVNTDLWRLVRASISCEILKNWFMLSLRISSFI